MSKDVLNDTTFTWHIKHPKFEPLPVLKKQAIEKLAKPPAFSLLFGYLGITLLFNMY